MDSTIIAALIGLVGVIAAAIIAATIGRPRHPETGPRGPSDDMSPPPTPRKGTWTPGKGRANNWAAEKECLNRLIALIGRRWDTQQKSNSEPEYYWFLGDNDCRELLDAVRREAEMLGLTVGPGDGSGDVGIFVEPDDSGGYRLVYAY